MSAIPVVYVAHPLSAPTREGIEVNRSAAAKWAAWIAVTFRVAVVADWIWMTGELAETPGNRSFGLDCDCALVDRCDAMIMVGPRVSEGMRQEAEHALSVLDWTTIEPFVQLAPLPTSATEHMREQLREAIWKGRARRRGAA